MTQQQQTTGEKGDDERQGLLGKLFGGGGKSFKKAKMGMELQMYYNEEVRVCLRTRESTCILSIGPSVSVRVYAGRW